MELFISFICFVTGLRAPGAGVSGDAPRPSSRSIVSCGPGSRALCFPVSCYARLQVVLLALRLAVATVWGLEGTFEECKAWSGRTLCALDATTTLPFCGGALEAAFTGDKRDGSSSGWSPVWRLLAWQRGRWG